MRKEEYLPIGKIVGVHGIHGNLKILSYAESLAVFKPESRLVLKTADGREKIYTINWVKPHSKTTLLSLSGIKDRSSAEALIGAELLIEKAVLPELEEGTFYWFDLIGLSVFTVEEQYIGQIESVLPTGSNDVYVVKDPKRGPKYEKLIPALESVIRSVDLKKKIMLVDLPEGL